jgi:hypothetical protein
MKKRLVTTKKGPFHEEPLDFISVEFMPQNSGIKRYLNSWTYPLMYSASVSNPLTRMM